MNGINTELDAVSEIRNGSLVNLDSLGQSVSNRLQEEYSELLRLAAGMPGPDRKPEPEELLRPATGMPGPDRKPEPASQVFQPIIKSGSSSSRHTPVDHQPDRSSPQITIQAHSGKGNLNWNSVYSVQQPKARNAAASKGNKTANRFSIANTPEDDTDPEESDPLFTNTMVSSVHSSVIEPAVNDLSEKLDVWLRKLKSDILGEVGNKTIQALQNQKAELRHTIEEINTERLQLELELNRLNEMICTCEQSMARKDTVIENMTEALAKQRDKVLMAQAFYQARTKCMEAKTERFLEALATQHNARRLLQKVCRAWYGIIRENSKIKMQQLYEKQAQDICKQLTMDYEDKIRAMNKELEDMKRLLKYRNGERGQCINELKKAFMRGMCALNVETMTAFSQEEGQCIPPSEFEENSNACNINNNLEPLLPEKDDHQTKSLLQDVIDSCGHGPLPGTGQISLSDIGAAQLQKSKPKPSKAKTRPSTASAGTSALKVWGQSQALAPPMTSVIVERHDPVTKQTVGKATAIRYPKHSSSKPAAGHTKHKHSGKRLLVTQSMPSSQAFSTFQPLAGQSAIITSAPGIRVVE